MRAAASGGGWADVLKDPMRTIHTVRHLHPGQVTNRAMRRLQPVRRGAARDRNVELAPRAAVGPAAGSAAAFDGRSFCFLNRRIVWQGSDRWFPADAEPLWVYNLHYFQYLWHATPAAASRLITDWIDANADAHTVAWDPYPISLRVREWTEWLLAHPGVEPTLRRAIVDSLAEQIDVLAQRLEFHLMGNHLLENAITLCWAGLSFTGRPADLWRRQGVALLKEELARQLLSDGTHDERSPMYQALIAEALLRLAEVAVRSPHADRADIREAASAAGLALVQSLASLVHPDGGYTLLNDAAFGIAPALSDLTTRFGLTLPSRGRVWWLPGAGYGGYRGQSGTYLAFDGGPIGPDHQPGHGHADTLTFELTHHGQRLVTDTGAFSYTTGPARQYDRSTAAHNTLEVDGRDQSELWGSFRCARRTSSHWLHIQEQRNHVDLSAGYCGPGKGRHPVWHTRHIVAGDAGLSFLDDVRAAGAREATLRVHFAPGVRVQCAGRQWMIEESSGRTVGFLTSNEVEWHASTSPYHPEFGREIERTSLAARFSFRDHAAVKWHLVLQ